MTLIIWLINFTDYERENIRYSDQDILNMSFINNESNIFESEVKEQYEKENPLDDKDFHLKFYEPLQKIKPKITENIVSDYRVEKNLKSEGKNLLIIMLLL